LTSNSSLKRLLGVNTIAELKALSSAQKNDEEKGRCISFQMDIQVVDGEEKLTMCPRTLEEAIAYQNFSRLRSGELSIGIDIPVKLDEAYTAIYDQVGSSNFKKTDFAMELLAGGMDWLTPNYIAAGLQWLETRLHGPADGG
jgi:putative ATP-dependent endonuclease of the OLD family